jgi:hypothetical protein
MEYIAENTVKNTQGYDDDIVPVTDIQKHWKVLTFHENRLNRLDHHIRETALVDNVSDMQSIVSEISDLRNDIGELRLENQKLQTSLLDISTKVKS